jgi:hypothetical protein
LVNAVDAEYVILLIHTDTADGSRYPPVRERLRPKRIYEKTRHVDFRRNGWEIGRYQRLRRNPEQTR